MRKRTPIIWLGLLFTGINAFFWYNDLVYRLPTPVPENYKDVSNSTPQAVIIGHGKGALTTIRFKI